MKRHVGKKGDPFYEAQENHNLIGVANVFLECLFCDVKLQYAVPIISQQGEVRLNYLCCVRCSLLVMPYKFHFLNFLSFTSLPYVIKPTPTPNVTFPCLLSPIRERGGVEQGGTQLWEAGCARLGRGGGGVGWNVLF